MSSVGGAFGAVGLFIGLGVGHALGWSGEAAWFTGFGGMFLGLTIAAVFNRHKS